MNEHREIGSQSGDTNLYGYVLQDPINLVDSDGLRPDDPGKGLGYALGAFTGSYLNMYGENRKGSDKYWHCMANCTATNGSLDGSFFAEFLSDWREASDTIFKGDSASQCAADQKANKKGREKSKDSCSKKCGSSFPY